MNHYIAELRDIDIQKDSFRFRNNLSRVAEYMAFKISETLPYKIREVHTALGTAEVPVLTEFPVVASILRAGLPLHFGLLNVFDHSPNAFISAYRKYHKDGRFSVQIEYSSSPEIEGKILIISDAMIATGSSMLLAYRELLNKGRPAHTHIVAVVASSEGIEYLKRHLSNTEVTLWVGAVDDELTAQAYIVPGLGDAGDLAFGEKI